MSKQYVLTCRVWILLFVGAILVNAASSYPNLRRFVDLTFIEGMAGIILGGYLLARSLKPHARYARLGESSKSPYASFKTRTIDQTVGMRILIVGLLLLSCAVLIGEMWIRKIT
ncbi:MAG TPA: hypothetical protein VK503_06155 [Candidatus Bathyarchaeia archaeon]|nr:hypothetical protein [Candidatus Bathyarchaeia archaeon]